MQQSVVSWLYNMQNWNKCRRKLGVRNIEFKHHIASCFLLMYSAHTSYARPLPLYSHHIFNVYKNRLWETCTFRQEGTTEQYNTPTCLSSFSSYAASFDWQPIKQKKLGLPFYIQNTFATIHFSSNFSATEHIYIAT